MKPSWYLYLATQMTKGMVKITMALLQCRQLSSLCHCTTVLCHSIYELFSSCCTANNYNV